jgi:hypothetical protein
LKGPAPRSHSTRVLKGIMSKIDGKSIDIICKPI